MARYQKTHMITFRVTEDEYRDLREKAAGNLSAYCRRRILRDEDRKREEKERNLKELTYQIRKIGVNINQVTARINSGFYYPQDAGRLLRQLEEVEGILQTVCLEDTATRM